MLSAKKEGAHQPVHSGIYRRNQTNPVDTTRRVHRSRSSPSPRLPTLSRQRMHTLTDTPDLARTIRSCTLTMDSNDTLLARGTRLTGCDLEKYISSPLSVAALATCILNITHINRRRTISCFQSPSSQALHPSFAIISVFNIQFPLVSTFVVSLYSHHCFGCVLFTLTAPILRATHITQPLYHSSIIRLNLPPQLRPTRGSIAS